MAFTIEVWRGNNLVKNTRVVVVFGSFFRGTSYSTTGNDGRAFFDDNTGQGVVKIGGNEVHAGYLSGTVKITLWESNLQIGARLRASFFMVVLFTKKVLEKGEEINIIMNMTLPRFPYTLDWVKLMADYLQQEISSDHPERYGANDLLIPVIFLAWAPGAGKTEWIESFPDLDNYIVLDSDLYRSLFEGYIGSNAAEFHQFASRVMDRMYSYCIKHGYNMIVDGTFANSQKASENIRQCEKKWLPFSIVLVMQDPIISYLYTKKREQEKLRNVPTEVFVEKYYKSVDVVRDIWKIYPSANILIAEKDREGKVFHTQYIETDEMFDRLTYSQYTKIHLLEKISAINTEITSYNTSLEMLLW
jgi:predicted ABC-type ATPase